jgi:hypothetical protein
VGKEADNVVASIRNRMVCTMAETMVLRVWVVVVLEVHDGQDDLMLLKDGQGIQCEGTAVLEAVLVYQVC